MKHVISNGITIYYHINRVSDNWAFIHPGSTMDYRHYIPLARMINNIGYSTIIIEPRGSGKSINVPADERYFTIDEHVNDIYSVIEKENIRYPLFIGHSYGFMPIVKYAYMYGNAERLIGVCSTYNFRKSSNGIRFNIFDKIFSRLVYFKSFFYNGNEYSFLGKPDWYISINNRVPMKYARMIYVSGKAIRRWDVEKELKEIKNPILMIYGNSDALVKVPPVSYGEIKVIDGSHALPVNEPDKVFRAIINSSR